MSSDKCWLYGLKTGMSPLESDMTGLNVKGKIYLHLAVFPGALYGGIVGWQHNGRDELDVHGSFDYGPKKAKLRRTRTNSGNKVF